MNGPKEPKNTVFCRKDLVKLLRENSCGKKEVPNA